MIMRDSESFLCRIDQPGALRSTVAPPYILPGVAGCSKLRKMMIKPHSKKHKHLRNDKN